jgi:uncharacterized membrane protein
MNSSHIAIAQSIVGSAITIGAADALWLTLRNKYHKTLFNDIQKSPLTIRWIPALLIYILIPVTLFLTAVKPSKTLQDAAYKGALTGFILYAFYDLTNYATLTNYTLDMTVTDVAWGTLVCTVGACAGYFFYRR